MRRAKRITPLPMIRIGVLYVPAAVEEFERTVNQTPEYENEIIEGYIPALIYWNEPSTWRKLEELAGRGVVWMPKEE